MTKELTKQQAEVWSLRHERKLTFQKIADQLGISTGNVYEACKVAEKKMGFDGSGVVLELKTPAERILEKFDEIAALSSEAGDEAALVLMEDRRLRALKYLDDTVLAQASATQLANVVAVMTGNIQLLNDKPTSITRFEDMRKLDEFLESVSEELRRRGEGPEVIDVTPEAE